MMHRSHTPRFTTLHVLVSTQAVSLRSIAHIRVVAALAVMLAIVAPAALAQVARPQFGAADLAASRVGTIASSSGGRVVAGALYVSLRAPGGLTEAIAIARRAGLDPITASALGFYRPLSEKRDGARLQSLEPQRRARIEEMARALARVVELHYDGGMHPEVAARMMMASAAVEYAEPVPAGSVESSSFIPNDSLIGQEQHLERIKAYEAWDLWKGDSNTVIGIVDAGIDNTHEDLAPNIRENPGEEGLDSLSRDKRTNGVDDDENGVIDDWRGANLNAPGDGSPHGDTRNVQHGTAVAGSAAAATNNRIGIAGVAFQCQFFPVKTMPVNGNALTKSYAGIEYCAREGMNVVNCSFGDRDFSRTQQTFVTYLIELYDIAIVAAGGNDPMYGQRYPAGFRGVMGVGALDANDVLATNFGEQIDVSAPVGATTVDNNRYTAGLVATSFSSPVAAGVVALARSRWPSLDAQQALAHVRLTSDTIAADGERYRLTGYGRVNALRAVSVDPMSRPAIVVDTLWLDDSTGAPREIFTIGERGEIRLRLHNLLGAARNVRARIVDYRDSDGSVLIDSAWHDVGELGTGAEATVSLGWPFRLDRPDTNRLNLRIEISADDGYRDYDFAAPFVYLDRPSIAVYSTGELALSVSSRGNIGYADYPENGYGIGVLYDNESFLFEGGFMAAIDGPRVVSNVRGADGSYQDRDFVALELPSDANRQTLTLSDAGAPEESEIGLELRVRTIVHLDVPNAFAMHVRARNTNGAPIDSLRLGMFADWDLAGDGDGQTIVTRDDASALVPLYAVISGSGFVVASGAVARDRAPIHYAIENGGALNLYAGFDRQKKWRTLSNGVAAREAGPADVSLVSGRVLTGLELDDEDTVLFVVGIGRTESEAVAGMQAIAIGEPSGIVTNERNDGRGTERVDENLLGAVRPNPASLIVRISVDLRAGGSLGLYDAMGGLVADLTGHIPDDGSGEVAIDATALPAGVYVVRATDARGSTMRRVSIVR